MKRIITILMSAMIALSMMPAMAFADVNETSADITWYGDGSSKEYTINNKAELEGLAQLVNGGNNFANKTIKLGQDIDLEGSAENPWTPIGVNSKSFSGSFDGDNHTISNLYVHDTTTNGKGFGLFGSAGSISNLTVENAHVMGNSAVAVVAGMSNGKIDNVKVTGKIEVGTTTNQGTQANFNSSYIGGIVGYGYPKVSNCQVIGDGTTTSIIGGRQVGGIIGFSGEGTAVRAENCVVKNITVKGGKSVGGILGWAHYGNGINSCSVDNVVINLTASSDLDSVGVLVGTSNGNTGYSNRYAGNTATNSNLYVNGEEKEVNKVESLYSLYGSDYCINEGNNTYAYYVGTLSDAITKSKNGETIILFKEATGSITIPEGKDITIDLNGYYIMGDTNVPAITNEGSLTIKNGKVVGDVINNSALTIKDGTVIGEISGNAYTLDNATVGSAAAYVGTSKANSYLTLQEAVNAVASGKTSSAYIHLMSDNSEEITVPESTRTINIYDNGYALSGNVTNNGVLAFGTSSGTNTWNITNNGKLTFSKNQQTGCTVKNNGLLAINSGGNYNLSNIQNSEEGIVSITGGTFLTKPVDEWIAFGYKAERNDENNNYEAVLMSDSEAVSTGAVARYSSSTSKSRKYYKSVQEGIQYGALHLLADVNEDVSKTNSIDLYCENYTFTGSLSCPGKTLYIDNGTATVTNLECGTFYGGYGSDEANITVKNGVANKIVIAKNASVTIEDGEYTGSITINPDGNASLTITGGTFASDPSAYVPELSCYTIDKQSEPVLWTVAANHTWDEGTVTKEPTYDVAGEKAFTCTIDGCGKTKTEEIPKKTRPSTPTTPSDPDNVTNSGSAGTDNAQTSADMSDKVDVTDGAASTVVDKDTADKIIDKAVANESKEVVIKAETEKGEATSSTVALPESTVQALAEKTEASVTIKTDSATVTLDKAAVDATAAQAGTDGEVKLVVETVENTEDTLKVELKLVTSKGTVTDFQGGNVTVTVPVNEELAGKTIVCVYIDNNGKYTKMEGSLSADRKSYTFTTGHFSTYAILEEAEADAIIAKQNIKVGIASVKLYTAKGGKLRVKASAKNATGYRVYYKKSSWKNYKTYTKGKVKTLDKTFKKLSKGKYTVKVKAYYKDYDGTKAVTWGSTSKAKSIRVKK